MTSHYVEKCIHGTVYAQCRCPDPNKRVTQVPCGNLCVVQTTDSTDPVEVLFWDHDADDRRGDDQSVGIWRDRVKAKAWVDAQNDKLLAPINAARDHEYADKLARYHTALSKYNSFMRNTLPKLPIPPVHVTAEFFTHYEDGKYRKYPLDHYFVRDIQFEDERLVS